MALGFSVRSFLILIGRRWPKVHQCQASGHRNRDVEQGIAHVLGREVLGGGLTDSMKPEWHLVGVFGWYISETPEAY